jgi:hypothetical protein
LEEKAKRALSVLLWRRAPVRASHPWGVVPMLTAGHPECYSGRTIPCGRCMGRGSLVRLMAVEARSERG